VPQWQWLTLAASASVDPVPHQGELPWDAAPQDDLDGEDVDDSVSVVGSEAASVAYSVANSSINPATGERDECAVCFERKPGALLLPCKHNIFCLPCANELFDAVRPCPLCSEQIDTVVPVLQPTRARKAK
jgi:hypothetical protein